MKMNSEIATLAQAEEDIVDDEDNDEDDCEGGTEDGDCGILDTCAFDVPHFPYIDDEDVEEEEKERRWRDGGDRTLFSSLFEEDFCGPSPYRYVVVSGTPLKILEHLLSDLRLDDQRGAMENRESGKVKNTHQTFRITKYTQ